MYHLPEYEPSEEIWKNIEARLNDDTLQKAISQLPAYEPDEKNWDGIIAQLTVVQPKSRMGAWLAIAVAASVILVAGILFFYVSIPDNVRYSEEKIDDNLLLRPADDSQKQYEMLMAYCKQQTYVCQNQEFERLKTELEELNTASNELKSAIGNYNTEPELIEQLTSIEQQKSDIIRKMVTKI
ncbi:hypothetical protein [Emticicia sp. 17c]|uniref:hypothetical protein n=1 Tax=Emticicia sp. 17c TaxID=3127704 RepID=UPI00301B8142